MQITHLTIPLAQIEVTGDYDLHPWQETHIPEDLWDSLARFTVLHPPLVKQIDDNEFALITGKKRISFAQQSSWDVLPCLVVNDACEEEILDLLYEEQALVAPLTLAEKARLLQIFMEKSGQSLTPELLTKLNLPGNVGQSTVLLKILTSPLQLVNAIHSGFIKEKMAWELLRMDSDNERLKIVQFFRYLGLGDGKQRRFLQLLRDIARKNKKTIAELLAEDSIQTVLTDTGFNIPQKINVLSATLQQMLTPHLHAAQHAFSEETRNMKLPANWEVFPSTSFEKDSVTLSVTFADLASLQKNLPQIKAILGDRTCP